MAVRLSFVIPVKNDAQRLRTCLQSIMASRGNTLDVEVVVVDNGSSDPSPDVAREIGARVVVLPDLKVSELRNRGVALTTGAAIAFVDADNEIVPGWVGAALDNLSVEGVGATGAQYHAPPAGTWVQRSYGLLRGLTRARADVGWIGSGNLAVTRRAFNAVGGFDSSLEACEDVDFCHRLTASGWRVLGDPRLGSVHHGDPRSLKHLFLSELWRGRDNLRVTFRRPIQWASVPSGLVPVADAVLLLIVLWSLARWPWTGASAPVVAGTALLVVALGALAKLAKAAGRTPGLGPVSWAQGFVVAAVYDLARAVALVTRTPHRAARRPTHRPTHRRTPAGAP